MLEIDKQYLETPFYGRRLMTGHLKKQGYSVNNKKIRRLMRSMGLEAMYPKPKRIAIERKYGKFPYLLRNIDITDKNQAWGTDITYIPVLNGYLYLVAVIDLYSRFVLSWKLSNNLESDFCILALEEALRYGIPEIMNSDQGIQFTSHAYVEALRTKNIRISMSGKGRCFDNIMVERFWRSFKYEEVYLNQYCSGEEAFQSIGSYLNIYNYSRPHSSLGYETPAIVYGL
jgi:putative transposase